MSKIELRVLSGSQSGTLIPIPEGRFLIGRETDCHLRPNSELISRHHCAFTADAHGLRVRDLGSTNGTFVNGERLQGTVPLKPGDRVAAGKVLLEVVIDGLPEASSVETIHASAGDTVISSARPAVPKVDPGLSLDDFGDALAALEDDAPAIEGPTTVDDTAAAPAAAGADTLEFSTADPAALAAAAAAQQQQFVYNPWGGMPQYQYPPGYPQYPPQYPQMPYGYGYPYPGPPQGMPPQGMPPGYGYPPQQPAAAESEPTEAAEASGMPEIRLPDPSETGAKEPEPKPATPAAPAAGGDPKKVHIPTAAQDIINSYLNRRPKSG